MNLSPISYAGLNINDGAAFSARLPGDSWMNQLPVDAHFSPRADADPLYSAHVRHEKPITLYVQLLGAAPHAQIDVLNKAFDLRMAAEAQLVAADADDGGRQWFLNAIPTAVKLTGRLYAVTLKAGFGLWRSATQHSDAWSLTASGQTHTLSPNPVGNKANLPILRFKPTAPKSADWAYRRLVTITNPIDRTLIDAFDLTAGGWNTTTPIGAGKMQASGADLRAIVDGVEVDRWFGAGSNGINQTATKVWANLTLSPRIELAVNGAIAGGGALATISFKKTNANKSAIKRLPPRGEALLGSELFSWTAVDKTALTLTGVTRAILGTSMAAHADGDTLKWLEHEIWLVYGDAALAAPVTDDTRKPVMDLTSTNSSKVFTVMTDNGGARMGAWAGRVVTAKGPDSGVYGGAHHTDASPATEMGMSLLSWLNGTLWQSESAEIVWQLAVPQGVTTITANGSKYRNSASFPALAELAVSADGKNWSQVWNEAAGTLNSWVTFTHTSVALGATYPYVRFRFKGSLGAGANFESDFEIDGATLTLDSAGVPAITLYAEQSTYDLDLRVDNLTTGEYFLLRRQLALNETLEVDCASRVCTKLADNTRGPLIDRPDGQVDWLTLAPGTANSLQVTETGLAGLAVTCLWNDWNL